VRAMSHGSGLSSGSTRIRFDLGSNFPMRFDYIHFSIYIYI
jgi:hypothetical protein